MNGAALINRGWLGSLVQQAITEVPAHDAFPSGVLRL